MLPHKVVLAIFATLLSQGNVVSALPQPVFNANGDFISGRAAPAAELIEIREAAPGNEITFHEQQNLEKRIDFWTGMSRASDIVVLCGACAGVGHLTWRNMPHRHKEAITKGIASAVQRIPGLRGTTPTDVEHGLERAGNVALNALGVAAGNPNPGH